jgi:hypothetical protein
MQRLTSLGCFSLLIVACGNDLAREQLARLNSQLGETSTKQSIRDSLATYPELRLHEVEASKWVVATPSGLFQQNWVLWLSFSKDCLKKSEFRIADNAAWRPAGAPEDREFPAEICSQRAAQ